MRTTNDVTVIWDGRRAGPGGAYIFADQHPTLIPASAWRVDRTSVRATVERLLQQKPMTMRQLADASGVDVHNINGALSQLQKHDVVAVIGSVPLTRADGRQAYYGRSKEKLYALTGGAA